MQVEDLNKHEAWRSATVAVLLKMRTWAMRYGASPLKVWDMLSERTRLATRRATSVESWASTIMRSFQISTVDAETSNALVDLSGCVGLDVEEWLTFVADEHQFLFAMARLEFDRTKKARKQRTEETVQAAGDLIGSIGEAPPTKPKAKRKPKTEPAQGELI